METSMYRLIRRYALDDFVFIFRSFFLFLILCLFIFARLFFIVLLCQIWLFIFMSQSVSRPMVFPISPLLGTSNSTISFSNDNRANGRIVAKLNMDDNEERCIQSFNHCDDGKLVFWWAIDDGSCVNACIFLWEPTAACQIIGFRPLGLVNKRFPIFIATILFCFAVRRCSRGKNLELSPAGKPVKRVDCWLILVHLVSSGWSDTVRYRTKI